MNLTEVRKPPGSRERVRRLARTSLVLAVAAVGMFVVAPASPATADVFPPSPYVRVRTQVSGPVNTFVAGTVSCPAGTKVVAAGAGNIPGLAPGDAEITAIIPTGNSLGVNAAGWIRVPGGSLTVVATCAPAALFASFVRLEQTFPYTGSAFRRAVLRCPGGMHAIGGGGVVLTSTGGFSPFAAGMVANTFTSNGTGWLVAITDALPSDSLLISTWCAPNDKTSIAMLGVPIRPGKIEIAVSFCPDALPYALTGGVFIARADGSEAAGTLNISMQDGDSGWVVGGSSPTPNATIFALVRCFAT